MDKEYSKREIDMFHKSIDEKLGRIETQVTRTNGRVSALEKWMYTVIGAVAIIAFLIGADFINLAGLI